MTILFTCATKECPECSQKNVSLVTANLQEATKHSTDNMSKMWISEHGENEARGILAGASVVLEVGESDFINTNIDTESPGKKIIVVDIETTNFLQRGGLITEIGIVELDLGTGKTEVLYDELVCEEGLCEEHKTSWIFENSDLKFEDVAAAKPLDKEKLQLIFDKYPATAYNKKFDFDFLRSRGIEVRELPCPMIVSTNICKIPSAKGGFKWPSFQEAFDFFFPDVEYKEAHRGCDDAVNEAKVVYELFKRGEFEVDGA